MTLRVSNGTANETIGKEIMREAPVIAYALLGILVVVLLVIWIKPLFVMCCRKKSQFPEKRASVRYNSDECPFCLEQIKNMVEISCGHAFCARCMSDYSKSKRGALLLCPVCRREFACIFKNYEHDIESPAAEVEEEINDYNIRYGGEQKKFCQLLKDFPFVFKSFLRNCCTPGMVGKSVCMILMIVCVMIYIVSPYDLFPESVFGIFGYIDDISVLIYVIFFIGKIMLTVIFRNRNNGN
jgi:uncharacterized membrane protein YkvA (DUF1232 family)